MSNMTDRIQDKNLIQLAKQQYETQKRSTIPSEIVRLVSRGQVYAENHPLRTGTIEMRYMTAYDEDILTNPSYIREGVVLDKLLESLIVTPVDYDSIARIDKNGLVISARILSYGKDYAVQVKDPKTSNLLNRVVDLTRLKYSDFDLVSDAAGEFAYELENGTQLKFKFLQTSDTVEKVSDFLEQTICEVNGNRDNTSIQNFIRYEFLARESKKFRKYIEDNTPSILATYDFEGEDGSAFSAGFQIGADLFWF